MRKLRPREVQSYLPIKTQITDALPGSEHNWSDPAFNIILQLSEAKCTLEELSSDVYKIRRGKTVTLKQGFQWNKLPGSLGKASSRPCQSFSYEHQGRCKRRHLTVISIPGMERQRENICFSLPAGFLQLFGFSCDLNYYMKNRLQQFSLTATVYSSWINNSEHGRPVGLAFGKPLI